MEDQWLRCAFPMTFHCSDTAKMRSHGLQHWRMANQTGKGKFGQDNILNDEIFFYLNQNSRKEHKEALLSGGKPDRDACDA